MGTTISKYPEEDIFNKRFMSNFKCVNMKKKNGWLPGCETPLYQQHFPLLIGRICSIHLNIKVMSLVWTSPLAPESCNGQLSILYFF